MDEENAKRLSEPVGGEQPSEVADDFESDPAFAPIIERMRAETAAEPHPGFTQQVMAVIAEMQTAKTGSTAFWQQVRRRIAATVAYLTDTPSAADIALCFLLAGFFYFMLGIIFFFGLKSIEPLPATAQWLRLQPQIAMLTAGVLGTLGVLLLLDGRLAMRLARIGTLAFIVFSVFNGTWFGVTGAASYRLFGLLCFTLAPVLLGLFLAASLQRFRSRATAG